MKTFFMDYGIKWKGNKTKGQTKEENEYFNELLEVMKGDHTNFTDPTFRPSHLLSSDYLPLDKIKDKI